MSKARADHLAKYTPPDVYAVEFTAADAPVPLRPYRHVQTAFILSGGGARGALQVGALRALMEHGIYPDIVVGSSAGAWNGTAIAHMPTLEGVKRLTALWNEATVSRILLGRRRCIGSALLLNCMLAWDGLRRMRRGHASLCTDTGLRELLGAHLGDMTFADLALPLRILATDLEDGERALLGNGDLMSALLASCAIPGIFPPVRIGDRLYADGGSLESACFAAAVAQGARRIFVLLIGPDGLDVTSRSAALASNITSLSAADVFERSMSIRQTAELRQAMRELPAGIETHVITLSPGKGGFFDFARVPEWIDRGYALTCTYMAGALAAHEDSTRAEGHEERVTAYGDLVPVPA